MSKKQTLRALVNERLTAAAEDIFALFEKTIAEYEEELIRSKNENRSKQRLTDETNPTVQPLKAGAEVQTPDPDVEDEITGTPEIKEEPEEEQLLSSCPDSITVCVKGEESVTLPSQTEHSEVTAGLSSGTDFPSDAQEDAEGASVSDNQLDLELPFSCSDVKMEPVDNGEYSNVFYNLNSSSSLQYNSAPETNFTPNDVSGNSRADRNRCLCPICKKSFMNKHSLLVHLRIHTGERPYHCAHCEKTFSQKSNLDKHTRVHTGEKPYSCSICMKQFADKCNLDKHVRIHTGERPYSCSLCWKTFTQSSAVKIHMATHNHKPRLITAVQFTPKHSPNR